MAARNQAELTQKRRRLIAAGAVVVATLLVLYLLGSVLLTLGISVVVAYVLLPVARLLERGMPWRDRREGLSRGIAVSVIFIGILGLTAGMLALVIPPTVEQGQRFAEEFPEFFSSARATVEGWLTRYTEQIPPDIRAQIENGLAGAGGTLSDAAWNVVTQTVAVLSGSFSLMLGLVTAPVLVFYLIKDSSGIRSSLSSPFPRSIRPYLQDALDIADRTVGSYIRGQVILGLVVGAVVTVGLLLMGVPFAYVLGVIAGLTELVPVIGPWIGGAVGVLVTLATEPAMVPWVILLYLGVQIVENVLLVPRIQGDALNLHPVAVILVIVIASNYFGLWGVILGPPVVSLLRDLAVYFVREWNLPPGSGEQGPEVAEHVGENGAGEVSTGDDCPPGE